MSRQLPPVSADILFAIEEALSEPRFQGVSLGSTLGDYLSSELAQGHGDWSRKAVIRHHIHGLFHSFSQSIHQDALPRDKTGCYVMTLISDMPKLRDLVFPVAEYLGGANCIIVGDKPESIPESLSAVSFIARSGIAKISLNKWRAEFAKVRNELKQRLVTILEQKNVPRYIVPRLLDVLIINSQTVMAYGQFLDILQPSAVITEYDRNSNAACLILAAKKRSIPTISMLHGVINPPYGYTPLLADYLFCWGEQQRDLLTSMGVENKRIIVTGCQRIHRSICANKIDALQKAGLQSGKPVILLVTNPCHPVQRHKLVNAFCSAGLARLGFTPVVRLHPAEDIGFYQEHQEQNPDVHFMTNTTWTVDEALAAADVVVCHDSGFGSDSLIKGKPVIIADLLDLPLRSSSALVEHGGCPRVTSVNELAVTVERILSDAVYREELHLQAEKFVLYFCAAFGDDAAQNVANEIHKLKIAS